MNTSSQNKKELIFDWKEISKKYKKDPQGVEAFIKQSKQDIAEMLIDFTKKKNLVGDLLRRCGTQTCFNNVILSADDVWGEINLTIGFLLERWENYGLNKIKNKKVNHATIKGELRMDTQDDIIGYFRHSLINAFADLFVKYNAQKRAANEVAFSSVFLKNDEENERMFEETIVSDCSIKTNLNSKKKDMIRCLRRYDRENQTRLTKLFVALMNPRYNGAVTVIQGRLKINNKNFNDSKALIEKILKTEFMDVSSEIIGELESKRSLFEDLELGNKFSRKYKSRKAQKKLENKKARPCRMNVIFGQKVHPSECDKWVYYATVLVERSKTLKIIPYSSDNWEKIYIKEETIEGSSNQMSKIRPKLEKLIKKSIVEAKKLSGENVSVAEEEEDDSFLLAA